MNNIKLSEFVDKEWREYSLYTIEERAIPSMVDGFKPVHRFIMHSALKCANKSMSKVTAIAGPVAEYGYHHGEGNAQDAAKLMAADWCNNQPLLLGDGNFGDRLVPTGAAPRYIFAKVHPIFHQIYLDFNLCPAHSDDEHIPPRYYLPILPMVLVNGVSGIATGYATDILPYSLESIRDICIKYVKGEDISGIELTPKFYGFTGKVVRNDKGGWNQIGTITMQGKTTAIITELPFKYDREGYIKVLDALEEAGTIIRYEDQCDENGFRFKVDLKRGWDEKSDEDLIKIFKLSSSITENLNVLDENRKLRHYDSPNDLVKDFCDFRLPYYQKRIDAKVIETQLALDIAVAKVRFIQMVLNQTIVFKGKSKAELTDELTQTFRVDIVPSLLGMEFYSLTKDEIQKQMTLAKGLDSELKFWKDANPNDLFETDLREIQ